MDHLTRIYMNETKTLSNRTKSDLMNTRNTHLATLPLQKLPSGVEINADSSQGLLGQINYLAQKRPIKLL